MQVLDQFRDNDGVLWSLCAPTNLVSDGLGRYILLDIVSEKGHHLLAPHEVFTDWFPPVGGTVRQTHINEAANPDGSHNVSWLVEGQGWVPAGRLMPPVSDVHPKQRRIEAKRLQLEEVTL